MVGWDRSAIAQPFAPGRLVPRRPAPRPRGGCLHRNCCCWEAVAAAAVLGVDAVADAADGAAQGSWVAEEEQQMKAARD